VEGDIPAALDAFTQAVRLNPNEPSIRQELAGAYAAEGRVDAAFAELVAGLLVNPGYAPLHAAIGQLRLDNGQPMDADPCVHARAGAEPGTIRSALCARGRPQAGWQGR
jgi:Flp pilus assembly protein TadD